MDRGDLILDSEMLFEQRPRVSVNQKVSKRLSSLIIQTSSDYWGESLESWSHHRLNPPVSLNDPQCFSLSRREMMFSDIELLLLCYAFLISFGAGNYIYSSRVWHLLLLLTHVERCLESLENGLQCFSNMEGFPRVMIIYYGLEQYSTEGPKAEKEH